jgi:general secretion pathway protein E
VSALAHGTDPSAAITAEPVGWTFQFAVWPHDLAQRHRALLVRDPHDRCLLLADRGEDPLLVQVASARTCAPVRWQVVGSEVLDHWLALGEQGFRALDAVDASADAAGAGAPAGTAAAHELSASRLASESSPAVRLLDALLYDALRDGASDLHVECTPIGAQVRARIDGVMLPLRRIDGTALAEQIVSRLKVMAELDIGERRLPQDGRFQLRVQGRTVDFRLSIMPSAHGEDAVVRVLDRAAIERAAGTLSLAALGLEPALCDAILTLARAPHGMLLVTGPTGSGKTTTLYAAISEILDGRDKVITIEDPVEYQLAGVVQIPVNEKKGLTFARGLRSILRHDPDRVMVGEIRDTETAQIAVQAALTGHLVFSTVHANNVFDVIGRFMHMGLDLYNVVAALNAVLAQRLLRLVCSHCAVAAIPTPAQRAPLAALDEAQPPALRHAIGCPHCRGTGYRGRRAVAELLRLDDTLRDLIAARAPMTQIKQAARERGFRPLRQAALAAAARGETTWEEVDRVTAD